MADQPLAEDIKLVHQLRSVRELRAVSNPLRVVVLRLLKEQERSVKELCEILGETSTRLYYHVRELERVGLVRLVRTETVSGSVLKYYRAVAQFVTIPFDVLHDDPDSPEAAAAINLEASAMQRAAVDVRQAFSLGIEDMTDEDYFVGRYYARLTRERAREFVRRLNELHMEFADSDDADGSLRFTISGALVPIGPVIEPTGETGGAEDFVS